MKLKRMFLFVLAITTCLATVPRLTTAQRGTDRLYQQMTQTEREAFVSAQARRIAREMSGNEYQFTRAFEMAIQKSVDFYARRIGNNSSQLTDARFIFERGQSVAPTLNSIFKKRNVSQLIGLYIPLIESEYVNIQAPNVAGAQGIFQFMPKTGEHLGLSPHDLLDVEKSADAAARYIMSSMKIFKEDPMKEALAILAYNRGTRSVERDLALVVNSQNDACSICALTENSDKLDSTFQNESVFYVPRFFAAAIIGENPQVFGLQTTPLSHF